jgi:hypothetical protein
MIRILYYIGVILAAWVLISVGVGVAWVLVVHVGWSISRHGRRGRPYTEDR